MLSAAQRAPTPDPINLPPEVLSLACAPTLTFEEPATPVRVTGSQNSSIHQNFAPGDLITINAGTDNGIEVGQLYYAASGAPRTTEIHRPRQSRDDSDNRVAAHLRSRQSMSLATISIRATRSTCRLSRAVRAADAADRVYRPGVPQRGNYGRVMVGNDNRRSFARGYFVVDRGSDHGVTPGSRFMIYRDNLTWGNFLFELGEAVAVDVGPSHRRCRRRCRAMPSWWATTSLS